MFGGTTIMIMFGSFLADVIRLAVQMDHLVFLVLNFGCLECILV